MMILTEVMELTLARSIDEIFQFGSILKFSAFTIVYLDLQNLLLCTNDETPVLKIGDFGFARFGLSYEILIQLGLNSYSDILVWATDVMLPT